MKGIEEIRINNYWAHMYESLVFDDEGKVVKSHVIDRSGNHSNSVLTDKSVEMIVDLILNGDLFTDGNHHKLESRYTPPRYKTAREARNGMYYGSLYLKFKHPKTLGIILEFSPDLDFESKILVYIGEDVMLFKLEDYTSEIHKAVIAKILSELNN